MRGHLEQRSKGSWTIWLELPRAADGKRQQKTITIKGTKREAEKRLTEIQRQQDTGLSVDLNRATVQEYLTSWLRDVVAIRNRPRTIESYTIIVHNHIIPAVGSIQLAKLQPSDVQRMEAALLASGLSANTVHHVHVALAKALKDAMRKGLVHRNVCQAVDPPSPGRYEVKVPDAQAIGQILTLARQTPYADVFHFIAFTGCRRGEAIAMKWENVDLDRGIVSIVETAQRIAGKGIVFQSTKSAAGRRGIALDTGTVAMLRAHRGQQLLYRMELGEVYQDHGLVFPGPLGGPLDPSVLTRNFEKVARKAGYSGIRLHDLRHGHAAGLIRAGTHPRVVQERLGHASAAFTMQVYGHVAAGLQADAAKAFASFMADSAR